MQHSSIGPFMHGQLRALTRSAYRIPHTRTIITRASRLPLGPLPSNVTNRTTQKPPTPLVVPRAPRNWVQEQPSDATTPDHQKIERRPTNNQIPFEMVHVVDPRTSKLSQTPRPLKEILKETNLQRYCVELVSNNAENPIVRIVSKAELEEKFKQMKKALRTGQRTSEAPKEVKLLYGVAKADLEHKLRKGRSHLEKGHRLIVSVATRPQQRLPTKEDRDALLGEIIAAVDGVGVQWKRMQVAGRQMTIYFKPPNAQDDPE